MNSKIKVLQAFLSKDGGLSGYIIRNYQYIDKDVFQFDFITYDSDLADQKKLKIWDQSFL